jgi:hypothetical protein
MEDPNLKPHFFEMIAEEPVLQRKIATKFGSEPDMIKELAEEENIFLTLPSILELIANHYNHFLPPQQRLVKAQFLNNSGSKSKDACILEDGCME